MPACTVETRPLDSVTTNANLALYHPIKYSLPTEHYKGTPHVRGHNLPHHSLELEYNVGDIEDCQEPIVAITS